ncbi:MAG: LacI family DNA-binding transcriptional regulator [Acidimicrobiales bacterium]|jgi:DNA-binding LacI/PurR family transcriptional regulator
MQEATIKEVARHADVSTATVSRSLRGLGGVSPRTAARVRKVADQLGYTVSPFASRLASGRAGAVAVLLPYVDRWFFGELLGAAEQVFREAGFDLLLYHVGDAETRQEYFSFRLLRKRVDGALLATLALTDPEISALRNLGVPICMVGAEVDGFHSITIDDVGAASTAVQHLLNLGHERVAIISGDLNQPMPFTVPQDRLAGYRAALEAAGIPLDPGLEAQGDFTVRGGESATAQLFGRKRPPTAVFAESDEMAFGALRTLARLGLQVPSDVSVVGFDDHPLAEYFDLTTISQSVRDQGRAIAQQLVSALVDHAQVQPAHIHAPTSLVIRGSTTVPGSLLRPARARSAARNKPTNSTRNETGLTKTERKR